VKGGSKWDLPVCQTDLLATFANILGKRLPNKAGEDSISFHQAFSETQITTPPRLPIIHHGANGRFAIRHEKWKLVMESKRRAEKRELYDLQADPGEKNDVRLEHPEIEKKLLKQLTDIVTSGATRLDVESKNDTPPWDDLGWIVK
jgi:arylsulfatase A